MAKLLLTQKAIDCITPSKKTMTVYDRSFPAFFLRVYPSGKRTFNVRFQHQGLRKLYVIGDASVMPLVQAKAAAKAKMHAVRYGVRADRLKPSLTLSAYADEFFPDYASHWKPSTLLGSERGYRRHIAPVLGDVPVAQLNRQHVEQWFAGMIENQGAANRLLPVLSVMMKQAEAYGYRPANSNPCHNIKRYPSSMMERYLTAEELRRLWQVIDSRPADEAAACMIIRLLMLTGCRSSEVRTLTWSCYRRGHWYLKDSKTGAKTVFLSTPARALLERWPRKGCYVFTGAHEHAPLSAAKLQTVWVQVREQAQLADVRLHDLRHTYASVALQHQVPLLTIARLLGHALPETTLKYAHLAKGDIQDAAQQVSRVLAGGMPV